MNTKLSLLFIPLTAQTFTSPASAELPRQPSSPILNTTSPPDRNPEDATSPTSPESPEAPSSSGPASDANRKDAQKYDLLESRSWCADAVTLCWDSDRPWLNGIRLIFEPQLGYLFQAGRNRIEVSDATMARAGIGLELNIYKGFVSLQAQFLFPFRVKLDAQSPDAEFISTEDKQLDVDYGGTIGLSLIDGIVAFGWGAIAYDDRDFVTGHRGNTSDSFAFVNVQPVSALRALLKPTKE